jgi:hypothetical protein
MSDLTEFNQSKKFQKIFIVIGVFTLFVTSILVLKVSKPAVEEEILPQEVVNQTYKIVSEQDGTLQVLGVSLEQVKAICTVIGQTSNCQYEDIELKKIQYQNSLEMKSSQSVKYQGMFLNLKTGKESQSVTIVDNILTASKAGKYRVTLFGDAGGVWQFILVVSKSSLQ